MLKLLFKILKFFEDKIFLWKSLINPGLRSSYKMQAFLWFRDNFYSLEIIRNLLELKNDINLYFNNTAIEISKISPEDRNEFDQVHLFMLYLVAVFLFFMKENFLFIFPASESAKLMHLLLLALIMVLSSWRFRRTTLLIMLNIGFLHVYGSMIFMIFSDFIWSMMFIYFEGTIFYYSPYLGILIYHGLFAIIMALFLFYPVEPRQWRHKAESMACFMFIFNWIFMLLLIIFYSYTIICLSFDCPKIMALDTIEYVSIILFTCFVNILALIFYAAAQVNQPSWKITKMGSSFILTKVSYPGYNIAGNIYQFIVYFLAFLALHQLIFALLHPDMIIYLCTLVSIFVFFYILWLIILKIFNQYNKQ